MDAQRTREADEPMNRRQWLGLGVVCLGIGLLVTERRFLPGAFEYVVILLGILGVIAGGLYAYARALATPRRWRPEPVEPGIRVPVPGDDLGAKSQDAFVRRLRSRVVRSLVDAGYTEEEAEAAVEDGSWTTDELAAWLLAANSASPPIGRQVYARLRGDSIDRRASRRAIAELRRLRDDHPSGDDPGTPSDQ